MRKISFIILSVLFLTNVGFVHASELALEKPMSEETPPKIFKNVEFAGHTASEKSAEILEILERLQSQLSQKKVRVDKTAWSWKQLDEFHYQLMMTMALDPARLDSKFIPAELEPVELTSKLESALKDLQSAKFIAEKFKITEAFEGYVQQVSEIIKMRKQRLYSASRRIAKKGTFEVYFKQMTEGLAKNAQGSMKLNVFWEESEREEILGKLKEFQAAFEHNKMAENKLSAVERLPASIESLDERLKWANILFWVLIPLVFLTGFFGGLLKRKNEHLLPEAEVFDDHQADGPSAK